LVVAVNKIDEYYPGDASSRNPLPTEAQTSVVGNTCNRKQYRQVLEDIDCGPENRRNVFAQLSTLATRLNGTNTHRLHASQKLSNAQPIKPHGMPQRH
jgi:hypothetical protein